MTDSSASSSAIFLEARDLHLTRDGRQLFSGVNFKLAAGNIVQIEGDNGAGKTSLLRILAGVSRLGYSGELLTDGNNVDRMRTEFNQNLLYIGHKAALKTTLTTAENLDWFQSLTGQTQGDVSQALAKVGLGGYEGVICQNLSVGQQRRVALARLYMSGARLWILDEPFTALDKNGVGQLEALFVDHANRGGALVLASHQRLGVDYPLQTIILGKG